MVTHGVACDAIWPILYRIFCVYQDRNIKIANRDRKRVTHIYIVKFVLSLTDRNVQIDNGMCSASVVHTHTHTHSLLFVKNCVHTWIACIQFFAMKIANMPLYDTLNLILCVLVWSQSGYLNRAELRLRYNINHLLCCSIGPWRMAWWKKIHTQTKVYLFSMTLLLLFCVHKTLFTKCECNSSRFVSAFLEWILHVKTLSTHHLNLLATCVHS